MVKHLRILIATIDGIPYASGAWTSNIDLLMCGGHMMHFITTRGEPSIFDKNGNHIWSIDSRYNAGSSYLNHITVPPQEFEKWIVYYWNHFQDNLKDHCGWEYDFVLCLGDRESEMCAKHGIPFITRYHTLPYYWVTGDKQKCYDIKKHALLTIENHNILPKDLIDAVIPHAIDLNRFNPTFDGKGVVLLATLNHIENPMYFVNACQNAKIQGTIAGDGAMRQDIETATKLFNYTNYIGSVPHSKVPKFLNQFKIGVVTVSESSPVQSCLKILEYTAAGLTPIVPVWVDSEIPNSWRVVYSDMHGLTRAMQHCYENDNTEKAKRNIVCLRESEYNAENLLPRFEELVENALRSTY